MPTDLEVTEMTTDTASDVLRIYEVGYQILPTVKDEDVEKVVAGIRSLIEKSGGSLIAEGAPQSMKLSYTMYKTENGRKVGHDRAHFGWVKFEAPAAAFRDLNEAIKNEPSILRHITFKTVREDTRAQIKMSLREVRRTDTIKSTPRKAQTPEVAGVVSEVDLDKALETITE